MVKKFKPLMDYIGIEPTAALLLRLCRDRALRLRPEPPSGVQPSGWRSLTHSKRHPPFEWLHFASALVAGYVGVWGAATLMGAPSAVQIRKPPDPGPDSRSRSAVLHFYPIRGALLASRSIVAAFLLFVSAVPAFAGTFAGCAQHLPFGIPTLANPGHTTPVCHPGFASLVDGDRLIPRWLAYRLTAEHSLGCIKRTDNFHTDTQLSPSHRARPSDYDDTLYDRGHHAPAEDFAWNLEEMKDSFSMANMAPQLHSLNAGIWKKGENDVRAWALERGELIVYVGSIVAAGDPTIGSNKVDVPAVFWKVVIDPARHQAIAWEMKQDAPSGGDLERWLRPISAIEHDAGIKFALPQGIDRDAVQMWTVDSHTWKTKHDAACSSHQ